MPTHLERARRWLRFVKLTGIPSTLTSAAAPATLTLLANPTDLVPVIRALHVDVAGHRARLRAVPAIASRVTWSFGDGSPIRVGSLQTHVYARPGTYTGTVTVYIHDLGQAAVTRTFRVRIR